MTRSYTVQSNYQTGDILVLTLAPKTVRDHMSFVPGQYAAISFWRSGRPTPMRCFSIASTSLSGVLQFAMRVRGGFTHAVAELRAGDAVRVQGPFGDFTIDPEHDTRVVMLAGGIGITPFMSMLRDATERSARLPITLLYSNRSCSSIPFYEELRSLEQRNPHLRLRFYSQDADGGVQDMVPGNITDHDIWELLRGSHAGSTYFICGPTGFSNNLKRMLVDGGVHESRVVSEAFTQASPLASANGADLRRLTYGFAAASLLIMVSLVMVLDLSRSVPKLAAAQAAVQRTTPQNNDNASTTTNTTTGASTTPSQTTPAPSYQPTYSYYQAPMSSVS
ncbi:MAG TPA: FAD-dependent oxidoreductase [Candidatus Saccharimonadales bacterium]|nr:FAD-dependent oxidoreductase [Candidatus Saccharimonadales bacterium]